jgi:hypothetical protein
MVEDQHRELAVAVSDIADCIRILDIAAPSTYLLRLALIRNSQG